MKYFKLTTLLIFFLVFNSCSKDSEEQEVPDTILPTVEFDIAGTANVSVEETIVVSNQIELNITAADAGGISKIEAFIDDEIKGEDTTAPYNIIINVSSYASKGTKSSKNASYIDYTLKVVATDKAGNISSSEQTIHVDNEIPTITDVSLIADTILNGETNSVTFDVLDNKELSSVIVYLNDESISEITDAVYEVNLNTSTLSDGNNELKIEAKDAAGNTGVYSVNFIVDNTGPEISLNSIIENQILDEFILLKPEVIDAHSDVVSLEVFLGDSSIFKFENETNFDMEFIPDNYAAGKNKLKLVALDSLGNQSDFEIDIQILRLLIEISIPEGFLRPSWSSFWVFASEMDGSPLAAKSVGIADNLVKIHAPAEFDLDKKYMITLLADEYTNPGSRNRITNIQGISRNNLPEINFNSPRNKTVVISNTASMVGFGNNEYVKGDGEDYSFNHYKSEMSSSFVVTNLSDTNSASSEYLLYSTSLEGVPYAHYRLLEPLANGSTINITDFNTDTDIGNASFSISNDPGIMNSQLQIKGYGSDTDYENGMFHEVFSKSPQKIFGVEYEYYFYSKFDSYSHRLVLDDYLTFRKGLPASSYTIPDWGLDYLQQGNDITITKNGTEHVLGKIQLIPTNGEDYYMTVLFDSQSADVVTLPQIPEEMKDLHIYNVAKNQGFNVNQVHLTSFDNITSYDDYLDGIIKSNKNHRDVSDKEEVKMKAANNVVTPFKIFYFD